MNHILAREGGKWSQKSGEKDTCGNSRIANVTNHTYLETKPGDTPVINIIRIHTLKRNQHVFVNLQGNRVRYDQDGQDSVCMVNRT